MPYRRPAKPWDCPLCGKVFNTPQATENHITDKHGGGGEPRKRKKVWIAEREPSLADISIEANLKRAMGESLDPLEESLLFDD